MKLSPFINPEEQSLYDVNHAIWTMARDLADDIAPNAEAIHYEGWIEQAIEELDAEGRICASRAQIIARAKQLALATS